MIYLYTLPRAIFGPSYLALHLLAWCARFMVVSFLTGRRDLETKVIQDWAKGAVRFAGIRAKITGLEKIPEGGVIYIFNHQSNLDIPIIHASIPKDFRFGAKSELFKIPLFSWAMRKSGALEIPRAHRSQAFKVLERAEERLRQGESFVLAPEGTRQDQDAIGDFRSGPFVVALKAQAPLVPVLIRGARRIMPKNSPLLNWRTLYNPVEVEILDPIHTRGMNYEDRDKLKILAHEKMRLAYDRRVN